MSSPRRLLLCSPAVALVAVLAACGGSSPEAQPPTSAAPVATSQAPAPSPTPTPEGVELTAENFASTIAAAQTGLAATSARFTMVIGTAGQTMNATGAMRAAADGSPEMQISMAVAEGTTIDMRLVGGQMYMSMGELTGGKFVQLDPSDPSLGIDMPTDVDPAQDAKDLEAAIQSVTKVGAPEVIGGVQAQAYDVVVDLSKVTGASKEQLDEAAAEVASTGVTLPTTMTYHYWVSADGLVRRIAYELLGTSSTMTFEGWGEPVDIQAPLADQITTLDDMAALDTE